jgi:hypothetical protein
MLTEQPAELEVRLVGVQLPPGVKVTVPVGAVAPDEAVSVTVAAHMKPMPTVPLVGQERIVEVESGTNGPTVIVNVAGALPECRESPE